MSDVPGTRLDVTLVAGGDFHDIDYARLELLKLFAEHEEIRVRVDDRTGHVALEVKGAS